MEDRIILVKSEDLSWQFNGENKPYYYEKNRYSYNGINYVDPFPCYYHNIELVKEQVEIVEKLFPMGISPMYYIASNEAYSRTNGQCSCQEIYDEEHKGKLASPFEPIITLWGKRIPLMPAMTRYLISHEYGHAVEEWIKFKLGIKDRDRKTFLTEYCKIRGVEYNEKYGGLNWHNAPSEIFANDFRIIIGGTENEFWPHDVEHPLECKKLVDYWNEELVKYKFKNE